MSLSSTPAIASSAIAGPSLHAMYSYRTRAHWQATVSEAARSLPRSFFLNQISARLGRKKAIAKEQSRWTSFLGKCSLNQLQGTSPVHHKRRKAIRHNSSSPSSEIPEEHIVNDDDSFLASMKGAAEEPLSNFSTKSAYEREGYVGLDEIPEHKLESIPEDLLNEVQGDNEYTKVHIEGDGPVSDKIRALVYEFRSVFKGTVQRAPSQAFEPFVLEVDDQLWHHPRNAGSIRSSSSREKEVELDRMLKVMLDNNIIEPCTDPYFSHPFLTPKKNGKWRLVLDFKSLNKATLNKYEWPIPNIKEMLTRIGDQHPEYFAVFDLTSGYYQAPIHKDSRKFTAFKTKKGTYRWLRLPMGLTHAGSYFQHQLSTRVLNGLLCVICELYLDD